MALVAPVHDTFMLGPSVYSNIAAGFSLEVALVTDISLTFMFNLLMLFNKTFPGGFKITLITFQLDPGML